jgi:hypothetical protein
MGGTFEYDKMAHVTDGFSEVNLCRQGWRRTADCDRRVLGYEGRGTGMATTGFVLSDTSILYHYFVS